MQAERTASERGRTGADGRGAQAIVGPSGRARARSSGRSAAFSALAGFVIGAVFWHFVGFWDFVSQVVFKGPVDDAPWSEAGPRKLEGSLSASVAVPLKIDASRCISLMRDPATSGVVARACEPSEATMVLKPSGGRQDHALVALKGRSGTLAAWQAQVEVSEAAEASEDQSAQSR